MKVIVYDKNTSKGEFGNYGYGKLRLIKKCEIVEELNGRYDLELIVDREDTKAKYINKWALISVDGQIFRVADKMENTFDNTIKVFCKHIFYDLDFGFIEDNRADNKNVLEAMQIAIPVDFKEVFEVSSDISELNTLYFVKKNGAENMFSIIDRWEQGELVRDNFNVAINRAKGKDNGVTFTYKKIEAIEVTEDPNDIVTRLYPTGKEGVHLAEKYIYIPNWTEEDYLPFHITREVKFENVSNEGDLRILAQKKANEIGLSRLNFTIKVHELSNTSLYSKMPELMKVEVGDIVTIKHDKLGVRVKVKCIKRTEEKVSNSVKLEFGQPLGNLFNNIANGSDLDIEFPNTDNLRNELFYYFNGKEIPFKNKDIQLALLRTATSETTNLMCHITINPLIEVDGVLKLRLTINHENIQYLPIVNLEAGYRVISFSIPLIAVEGGQTKVIRLWGEFDGQGIIPANSLHFAITGQNVAMGLIKIEPFTGARFEYAIEKPIVDLTKNITLV